MTAAIEIQKLVYDALNQQNSLIAALGGHRIYDDVPAGEPMPYIVFGKVESVDWSTSTEGGEEHFIDLEIWSNATGRKELLQIAAEIRNALDVLGDTLPATMTSQKLINLAPQSTLTTRREKNHLFKATMTLRAVSEPEMM